MRCGSRKRGYASSIPTRMTPRSAHACAPGSSMAVPGWIELFTRRLDALELRYMVTGSVASMIYGEPRMTLDVDLVVELAVERAADLLDGFPGTEFYIAGLVTRSHRARAARAGCARECDRAPCAARGRR